MDPRLPTLLSSWQADSRHDRTARSCSSCAPYKQPAAGADTGQLGHLSLLYVCRFWRLHAWACHKPASIVQVFSSLSAWCKPGMRELTSCSCTADSITHWRASSSTALKADGTSRSHCSLHVRAAWYSCLHSASVWADIPWVPQSTTETGSGSRRRQYSGCAAVPAQVGLLPLLWEAWLAQLCCIRQGSTPCVGGWSLGLWVASQKTVQRLTSEQTL